MGLLDRIASAGRSLFSAFPQPRATNAKPSQLTIQQWQPLVTTNWTIQNVLGALAQHELGNFQQSAMLASAFGRDDRISSCRNTRVRALVGRNGVGFKLEPSKLGDQRSAKKVATDMEACWSHAHPEPVLSKILSDGIDLGCSISRIHQDRIDGEWVPRLEPWDMQHVYWSEYELAYIVNTREGPMRADRNTGEWFVYEPAGQFGWMAGGVRPMGLPFMFRGFTQKDWARFCEKHGVPILAITEPAEEADSNKLAKKNFYERLRKMGKDGIIRLPQDKDGKGFDVKIVEPRDTSWQAFQGLLMRMDINVAVYYLGQNLSTEVTGGSHAAAASQNGVRLDYLGADAESLSSALREQVWCPWGRFNRAGWRDELAAWPTWNTSPPEDLKARAETIERFGMALERFDRAGVFVDVKQLAEHYRVPLLSDEEIEALKKKRAEERAANPPPVAAPSPPAKGGTEGKPPKEAK